MRECGNAEKGWPAYLGWDVQSPVWDVQITDDEDEERHCE